MLVCGVGGQSASLWCGIRVLVCGVGWQSASVWCWLGRGLVCVVSGQSAISAVLSDSIVCHV